MQEEVKNPMNFGYLGDEQITISAKEFMALKVAVEHGINATAESYMPEVLRYLSTSDGSQVENPSAEDIRLGVVIPVTDREATFNASNVKFKYSSKLTVDMVDAQQLIMEIHTRNVENGIAKSREELEKANELTEVK
jgi:hypothetical protein